MDTLPGNDPMENPPQPPLAGLNPADLLKQGAADDTFMDGAASSFNPPSVDEIASLFPQFEILELIGQGGMGAVYKVRQKDLDRIVALKILPPAIGETTGFSERFTREAKALAKLNHPGIVTLHEFGQQDGLYFILMEFVDGVNLGQLMKTKRIAPREALAIVPQICDALQFAHDQGIVHRDIKPENILLDRHGRVKVADFGIAKVVAVVCDPLRSGDTLVPENQTLAGKILGTPQYMAPEQIDHPSDVDHRADIYALGVVFYQMLTGELPGKDLQAPSRKVHIDVRLDEIVLKAMEKNPEQRYQQASVMKTRVETIEKTQQKTGEASVSSSQPPTGQGKRLSIGRLIFGCAIFGLLMGVREEFDAIWIRSAIAGLAAVLGLLVAYSRRGHAVDQTVDIKPPAGAANEENKPSSPRWRKLKWIVAACLVIGVLWFALRPPGRSYPGSSTSSSFKAPVMGRIEFKFTHAESLGGTSVSYDVKMWGDTQWKPSSGMIITLKDGQSLQFKSRVNAMNPDSPVAMVTTSSDDTNWGTKELKIGGGAQGRHLAFANGLRVEILWTPAATSIRNPEPPDPVQMQVMQRESKLSNEMHPVSRPETVQVLGEVGRMGSVELQESASLLDAIAAAGGWTENADLGKIRITIPGTPEAQTHDLNAILNGDAVNPPIAPGSVIEILKK